MRTKSAVCTAFLAVTFLATPEQILAQPALIDGSDIVSEGNPDGWQQILISNRPAFGEAAPWASMSMDADLSGAERVGSLRGIFGLGGSLGVVLDTSGDLPRMRGLAFSPTDNMRIEASGIVEENMRSIGGRVSVHFRF